MTGGEESIEWTTKADNWYILMDKEFHRGENRSKKLSEIAGLRDKILST